jgi:hypothetical protein
MRIVQLGGGAVAFEPEDAADRVGSFDARTLRDRGWSDEAIRNYERYRDGSRFLRRARALVGQRTEER